jgi:hypothetical protein
MEFQYVPLGYDCSTAQALKDLELREFALPFDWTQTHFIQILQCITDDFRKFHQDIKLINTPFGQRVIDNYGIQYPHDYPTIETEDDKKEINEENFYNEKKIVDNYKDYIDKVLEKYQRRINRFKEIFKTKKPIIILYRGCYSNAEAFKNSLHKYYNRNDIIFVIANKEENHNNNGIICCNPEKNGNWNDKSVWLEAIELAKQNILHLCTFQSPIY